MIPYYPHPYFIVGPFTFHAFAICVLSGVVLGFFYMVYLGRKEGIPSSYLESMGRFAVIPGFLSAHICEILFYQFDKLQRQGPMLLLRFWDGLSSYGGFLGALLGLLVFLKLNPKFKLVQVGDLTIQGLVIGWCFGRLGCTLAHDHPGILTDFPLAFAYPEGARHNLGFYEFLYTSLLILPVILWMRKKVYPAGSYIVVIALLYTPARFSFDFLRATPQNGGDIRFLGLTPAQYISVLSFCAALVLARRIKLRTSVPHQKN